MHNGGELVMEGVSADVLAELDSCSEPLDDKDIPSCSVPILPSLEIGDGDADLFGDLESPWSGGQRRNDVPWNKLSRDSNGPEDFPGGGSQDDPDLIYDYGDADTLQVELSELYSYSEVPEFLCNYHAFLEHWDTWRKGAPDVHTGSRDVSWEALPERTKLSFMENVLEHCERQEAPIRSEACRTALYLLQGAFLHIEKDHVLMVARDNAFRFHRLGALKLFVQLLLLEADAPRNLIRLPALSIADSKQMRTLCNILYSMVELMRRPDGMDSSHDEQRRELAEELGSVIFGKTIILQSLFELFLKFASGSAPHYPLKKILLLIWKILLASGGGMFELKKDKNERRAAAGLSPISEDTLEVAGRMRASTPPLSASEMVDGGKGRRNSTLSKYKTQPSNGSADTNAPAFWFSNVQESDEPPNVDDEREDIKEELEVKHIEHPTKRTDSQPEAFTTRPELPWSKSLPWTPKVRQEEIDRFIHTSRDKFVGVSLPDDNATLIGLPKPIEESIQVMRKYVYVSLSDVQLAKEKAIAKYPMSQKDDGVADSPVERMYQALLLQMGNYVIALLKVLLASSPTTKAKPDSLNVVTDVLPEHPPTNVIQSMRMTVDTNRHKEILVKTISSVILLLLKQLKTNHVYQFETVAQHLVMANCMALILKFLNQNIMGHVLARNEVPVLNYPACCYLTSPEISKEQLEVMGDQVIVWRNLHSCINLMRVLNKLAKWKRSRILVLVLFKSAAILKRALRVRHCVMQLYTLKALKLQSKFLGRQWRRMNMRTLSAIYEKVRHRLMDDWAYGNVPEHEVKRVDCQVEERKLRVLLDVFNNRRYHHILRPNAPYVQPGLEEFQSLDHSLAGALSMRVSLPDNFRYDYEEWLKREVFEAQIDWDQLLLQKTLT
ncbi:hypothetical protein RvY_19099 [Ramazzottius varieornatus]|uniref:Far11/STRP C-terminal domain-containing protein n=1 Tax=Ramazzottius varieornatus TaxID=947166 RepID=A0A1D1W9K2_RAMVA|nr:hypothetical protein RvY_19099 [Ramazzottius varieornatus]